jgi:hypothetical protein
VDRLDDLAADEFRQVLGRSFEGVDVDWRAGVEWGRIPESAPVLNSVEALSSSK